MKKENLMNKIKSIPKKVLALSVVVIILLVIGIGGMTSPIAYGSVYYHASNYEGDDFSGSMIFYPDNTMVVRNTNLDEDMKLLYYYRDGYIFFTAAETEAEYYHEVKAINEDFEAAINTPFYASKITAFKLTSEGLDDDYSTVYVCQNSSMMAAAWVVIEVALVISIAVSVIRHKKRNQTEQTNNETMEETL